MIDRKEKILYAKIFQKNVNGDQNQLKLASLLGYRMMKKSVPIEKVLDLHTEILLDFLSSKSDHESQVKETRASAQLLKETLKSYSEAYRDSVSGLEERSKELVAKTTDLEETVKGRTGQLERSRTDLLRKVDEISEDQGAMLAMIEDLNRVNEELTQTREKLKSSEKLAILGTLSMGLSHELRNPLGVIENAANILLNSAGEENRDLIKWTGRIKEQTRLCNRVIESTLGFSRHDFMSNDLLSIEEVVQKAVTRCNAEERVERPSTVPKTLCVKGDEEQLIQAIGYLITNGLESIPADKEIRLALNVTPSPENGSRLAEICVIDTGEGIEEKDISKIFEPFYSTKTGQIGLGLSLCNAIVSKHKGTMKVYSGDAETRFTMILPLTEDSGNE